MATPRAVQRQLEQADALIAQQASPQPADPTIEIVTDGSQLVQPQAPAQAPAAAPVQAPAPAPTAPRPDDGVDWKQRFLTTQGILQTELPAIRAAKAASDSKVSELSAEIAQLRQLLTTKQTTEPPKPTVDPRDVEAFGEPMMDMVRRYVTGAVEDMQSQMGRAFQDIDRRVSALEGSVQGVAKQTEESRDAQFWAVLGQLVPDHETINASSAWLEWLDGKDTLTGERRQALLDAAAAAKDPQRVAKFFEAFRASLPPAPSSALQSMVSPSPGGAGPSPSAQRPTQVVTQKFIQDFYRDITRGVYRGREDTDQKQIEAAINQAIAEGRVR